MKSFRDYISEEVVPTALVKDGSIDIDKEEVRASINMALAKVTSDSSITPYIALNRISKALSMFHIILPKRVYLEGAKGVEVHELRQFGDKMGMNDQGEFINEVPGKYFLFIQYGMNTPMNSGGQYAYPTMAGTFRVTAKVVDPIELNRLLDVAEITVSEECNAETQQLKAKMLALKEPMKDLATDGSPSTDADVATSERKSNKKLSAGSLDEAQLDEVGDTAKGQKKLAKVHKRAVDRIMKAVPINKPSDVKTAKKYSDVQQMAWDRLKEEYEKVEAGVKKTSSGTHTLHKRNPGHKTEYHTITSEREGHPKSVKTGSPKYIKKHWDKLEEKFGVYRKGGSIGEKPSTEPHKTFDSAEEAKAHAKSMNKVLSPGEKKYYGIKYHVKPIKEEQIDEVSLGKAAKTAILRNRGAERSAYASPYDYSPHIDVQRRKAGKTVDRIERKHGADAAKRVSKAMDKDTDKVWRGQMDEKHLTSAETRKKEEIVKSMKKGLAGFKERYGKRAKEVMYATATKRAKQVAEKLEFDPSTEIPKNS